MSHEHGSRAARSGPAKPEPGQAPSADAGTSAINPVWQQFATSSFAARRQAASSGVGWEAEADRTAIRVLGGTPPRAEELDDALTDAASSSGGSLPPAARRPAEQLLGRDFSRVRVHVGSTAHTDGAASAAVGRDIYFAPGLYSPNTRLGQALISHELTHVAQQGVAPASRPRPGVVADQLERMRGGEHPSGDGFHAAIQAFREANSDEELIARRAAILDPAHDLPELSPAPRGMRQRCDDGPKPAPKPAPKHPAAHLDVGLSEAEIDALAVKQGTFVDQKLADEKSLEARRKRLEEIEKRKQAKLPPAPAPAVDDSKIVVEDSDRVAEVATPPPPKKKTDAWTKKTPAEKLAFLSRATVAIASVSAYAKKHKLTHIEALLTKHPPHINEAIILEALEEGNYAWMSGSKFKVSMSWIEDVIKNPANGLPNTAHEAGGHFDYGDEIGNAVLKTYVAGNPSLKAELTGSGEDKARRRQALYLKYGYPETEIFAELYERRWLSGEGIASKPKAATDHPNEDFVAKLSRMNENLHPDVRDAALARLRKKAAEAQAAGKVRAADVKVLEDSITAVNAMWAAYRGATGVLRPKADQHGKEQIALDIEDKAKQILEAIDGQEWSDATRLVGELEKLAKDNGHDATWGKFVSAARKAIKLGSSSAT